MKITIQKQIGKSVVKFEVEEDKGKDALMAAGFLSETPSICGLCQSKDVVLSSNRAKGYSFVKVVCEGCKGQAQMGEYKDGGYYWKEWAVFQPSSKETSEAF